MVDWPTAHLVLNGDDYSLISSTDAVLTAEGHQFPVHSQVLSLKSAYFRGLFEVLGCGSPDDRIVVPLGDIRAEDVSNVLRLVYNAQEELQTKKDIMRTLLLAHHLGISECKKQLSVPLSDPGWLMHCGGYPVGNKCTKTLGGGAAKVSMSAGDENDAIQWLAVADRAEMAVLYSKCCAIVLKFITSAMDEEKEKIGREQFEENLTPAIVFDLARMATHVHGRSGVCSCHTKLPNGERVCYDCASEIARGSGSAKIAGPSK